MRFGISTRLAVASLAAMALLGVTACGKKDTAKPAASGSAEVASSGTAETVTPTTRASSTTGTIPGSATGNTLQWATTASATTSYGTHPGDSWAASQAIGPPDVTADSAAAECGDIGQAWASASRDTVDTLTLGYAKAVIPTGVNVRETYNPGAIVKVVVSGPDGQSNTVYQGQPTKDSTCPTFFVVKISGVNFPVNSVAVTVDQTQVQSWAEIDAVQLVGNLPTGGSTGSTGSSSTSTSTSLAP